MDENLIREVMYGLVQDFAEMLVDGIHNNADLFPYTISCLQFIASMKERNIEVDFHAFDQSILDLVYRELTSYLSH